MINRAFYKLNNKGTGFARPSLLPDIQLFAVHVFNTAILFVCFVFLRLPRDRIC